MSDKPRAPTFLPPDAKPCIWMTAGLVAYKLCDRDYDCDDCPLHAALRGTDPGTERQGEGARTRPGRWEFPADRLYHTSHTWVLKIDEMTARLGLDLLAARLLGHVNALVLPAARAPLHKGRVAFWLRCEAELVPLPAPLDGTLLRVNPEVQADPELMTRFPYEEGWLAEVRIREPLQSQRNLFAAPEARQRTARQLRILRRQVSRTLARSAQVGPTLADGGERLTDLRCILGSPRYRRLLLRFLR
jgi:glycine cleavage system H protein